MIKKLTWRNWALAMGVGAVVGASIGGLFPVVIAMGIIYGSASATMGMMAYQTWKLRRAMAKIQHDLDALAVTGDALTRTGEDLKRHGFELEVTTVAVKERTH